MNTTFFVVAALGMIAAGLAFLYVILRRNHPPVPRDAFQWLGVSLSGLLVLVATALLYLTLTAPEGTAGAATADAVPQVLPSELNRPAGDFPFRLVGDDREATLSAYRGSVVLLNFWATWCAPCRQELPELNRLQEAYRDRGLVVLTVSDEPRPDLLAFGQTMPLQTVSAYLPEGSTLPEPFSRTLAVRPTTYVVDREGLLRAYMVGAGDFGTFERAITPFL